ncbi:MAG: UDP-2,3-diacylglucosamine diphosphatase [Bacteroidia bacterium]|nr:UDP-2,3-diacylglucosamine diphosphatase [Bacteroidia bacterium]
MAERIYIASDMHFGAPTLQKSLPRERHFVKWLDSIKSDARELYLLGDVFDFWFEYKHSVPKGHVRLLGKLAELADLGVDIHIFTGNHDLWLKDYFPTEMGISVHRNPIIREWFGRSYYLAHGDGLGPGDHGYKAMKKVFTNPFSKWLFGWLHPNMGVGLARFLSGLSNKHDFDHPELSPEVDLMGRKEWLYVHSETILQSQPEISYFVYGHRHALIDDSLNHDARIVILGDWITYFSYLVIDQEKTELDVFPFIKH